MWGGGGEGGRERILNVSKRKTFGWFQLWIGLRSVRLIAIWRSSLVFCLDIVLLGSSLLAGAWPRRQWRHWRPIRFYCGRPSGSYRLSTKLATFVENTKEPTQTCHLLTVLINRESIAARVNSISRVCTKRADAWPTLINRPIVFRIYLHSFFLSFLFLFSNDTHPSFIISYRFDEKCQSMERMALISKTLTLAQTRHWLCRFWSW